VHSHQEHLHGFLEAAKEQGVEKIAVHAFTDGRDTLPQSGHTYLAELEAVLQDINIGFIATTSGRFYAMDRDNNWDRVEKVEAALFEGKGVLSQGKKPSAVMKELHATGVVDEHLEPVVFLDERGNSYSIAENDGVFFFNFRPDRARMLAQKIATRAKTHNLCFVTLTEYDKSIQSIVAFPPKTQETSLAAEIAKAGLSQVHIAETEKYAHATYFLNGGQEEPHERETHVLVESRKDVRTHDLAPEMQAEEITTKALQFLPHTDFVFINYANADMVGHTANFEAALKAVETIDQQLARLVPKVLEQGGVVCITADHGNAEQLVDPKTGSKYTAHTANPVPFIVTTKGGKLENGTLADVAPTVLKLLHLPQPAAMTGKNLLVK
jgi:2,3-bisphosphoglycerate-independent phosphoglycerate mutase